MVKTIIDMIVHPVVLGDHIARVMLMVGVAGAIYVGRMMYQM